MKKICFLILMIAAVTTTALAQNPIAVGQSQFNLGVGLSSWGVPIYIGLDHGIHKNITIGGEASFRSYRENYKNNRYNHGVIGISGNLNYHFNNVLNIPSNWDFYMGPNIGFYMWNSSDNYPGNAYSGLGIGGQIGGRYYLTEKFGLNLEFGGGNAFSGGKFGISLKL